MARARLSVPLTCALLLAGCGGRQSTLRPESDQTRKIAHLWWGMLAASGVVFAGALVMLAIAYRRRKREGLPVIGRNEAASSGLVIAFGIVVPAVALIVLFWIANVGVLKATSAPKLGSTSMTIEVVGRQWFWDVRYPGTSAVTANEIHIPVRTRVNVVATTDDVIHSFWVPELNRKIDTVPGHVNRVLLWADKPGVYRGQCAEFCGLQHTNMGLAVYADPPARFRAWLANMSRPAAVPATAAERAGRAYFLSEQCASCHTIAGTQAQGRIGPNLTHLASRSTLAALTIPNDPSHLSAWVHDPQQVKPGNKMPGLQLGAPRLQAIVAYLESLR